jgi:curli biogenesis system outer membrane secretion channel CsgG
MSTHQGAVPTACATAASVPASGDASQAPSTIAQSHPRGPIGRGRRTITDMAGSFVLAAVVDLTFRSLSQQLL